MCVKVKTSDGEIATIGALQQRWGSIVMEADYDEQFGIAMPNNCLCPIHILDSAKRSGRTVVPLESGDWLEPGG